ncbi:MAG: hypothetical protein WC975_06910 [Phycisphaerae bacterium]
MRRIAYSIQRTAYSKERKLRIDNFRLLSVCCPLSAVSGTLLGHRTHSTGRKGPMPDGCAICLSKVDRLPTEVGGLSGSFLGRVNHQRIRAGMEQINANPNDTIW